MHQPLHNAVARVFRVGAHAGHKADGIRSAVNVHFQRIHGNLGDQVIPVEAAQHVGPLQHRELGLLDLIVPPARFRQFLLRHLKGVAKQLIILFQIVRGQMAHLIIGPDGISHAFVLLHPCVRAYYSPAAKPASMRFFMRGTEAENTAVPAGCFPVPRPDKTAGISPLRQKGRL